MKRLKVSSSSGLSGSPIVANKRERQACQDGPAKAVPSRDGSFEGLAKGNFGSHAVLSGTVASCASFFGQPSRNRTH